MSPLEMASQWVRRSPRTAAACLGAGLLLIGLFLGRFSKPAGEYSGFWGGLDSQPSAERTVPAPILASCPTPKCLTVYVAPWCPHCRDATPGILALRDYLRKHDIHTNVVVGMDRPKALVEYAKQFGPDTVLDEKGELAAGGVPHFFVTDKAGHLLRDQAGVPQEIPDAKTFASMFGLP